MTCSLCNDFKYSKKPPQDGRSYNNGQITYVCNCGQRWYCYNDHFNLWSVVNDNVTWNNILGGCSHPVAVGTTSKNLPPGNYC